MAGIDWQDSKWLKPEALQGLTKAQQASCPHLSKGELAPFAETHPATFLKNSVVAMYLVEDPSWEAVRIAQRELAISRYRKTLSRQVKAQISGYGTGTGYGSGDGYGYGSGSGYGDGDGDDYGDGDGDDYGYGSGDGYGYGYGEPPQKAEVSP